MKIIRIRNASHIKLKGGTFHLDKNEMIEIVASHGNYDLHIEERNLPELSEEEKTQVQEHNHINAIRDYRNRTGCGLLESKMAIDAYRNNLKKKE